MSPKPRAVRLIWAAAPSLKSPPTETRSRYFSVAAFVWLFHAPPRMVQLPLIVRLVNRFVQPVPASALGYTVKTVTVPT